MGQLNFSDLSLCQYVQVVNFQIYILEKAALKVADNDSASYCAYLCVRRWPARGGTFQSIAPSIHGVYFQLY